MTEQAVALRRMGDGVYQWEPSPGVVYKVVRDSWRGVNTWDIYYPDGDSNHTITLADARKRIAAHRQSLTQA
jgi:hypothetical protein